MINKTNSFSNRLLTPSSFAKMLCVALSLLLIVCFIVFKGSKQSPSPKGRSASDVETTENSTESNNVLRAVEGSTNVSLTDREQALYRACKTYTDAVEGKNDVAKLTMACEYVAEMSTYVLDETAETRSAYSALVLGKSVCSGYAKAVQLLLASAGVKSEVIVGFVESENASHAWLICYLDLDEDGILETYHCDPTWCDTDVEGEQLDVTYMIMSDSEAMETRSWDYDSYPICETGVEYGTDVWEYAAEMDNAIMFTRMV